MLQRQIDNALLSHELSNIDIENFHVDFKCLKYISSLSLINCRISNFDGLEKLKNLSSVVLTRSYIADNFSSLTSNIQRLIIFDSDVNHINLLNNTSLKSLKICMTSINVKLSPINNLKRLKLTNSDNIILDSKLESLEKLTITNYCKDLDLSLFPNLIYLRIPAFSATFTLNSNPYKIAKLKWPFAFNHYKLRLKSVNISFKFKLKYFWFKFFYLMKNKDGFNRFSYLSFY